MTAIHPSPTSTDPAALPAPGRWVIDPGHAQVGFLGRHLQFTKVRGRFGGVEGVVQIADDPESSVVDVTIDMASVDSGNPTRDDHLRSADLFDVERFPTATFTGRGQGWEGDRGRLAGDLTIKDVTRPVVLDVEFLGAITDPWGADRIVFSAAAVIDREDWGITWNMALEAGGLLVSKRIELEIELEAVRDAG